MENQRIKSKKKIIIICIVIIVFISCIAIYKLTAISTDNYLYAHRIGDTRKQVTVTLYSKRDNLNDLESSSLYYYQEFFGIPSTLCYYYDDNDTVKEIAYVTYMVDGQTPEKYKRNAKAIINYYTKKDNNTKHSEPNIISNEENNYHYEWFSLSGEYVYTFVLNDAQFYMSVKSTKS